MAIFELKQTDTFSAWYKGLKDIRAKHRIQARLARMELGNFGDAEPIGEGVSEAKIDYGQGIRLYFVRRGKQIIVLLCGGDKSTQKRDILNAEFLARSV